MSGQQQYRIPSTVYKEMCTERWSDCPKVEGIGGVHKTSQMTDDKRD